MHCDYGTRQATVRILAVHGDACLAHTIQFWQGFLAYAKKHPARSAAVPTVIIPATPLSASQTH